MVKLSTIARKNIIFCKKEDTVDTIATIMVRHHIGCVLVKDPITEEFIGLIDDRMLFRLLTLGENPIPKTAEEIMIPLHLIEGELEIEDAWHKMENSNAERFCVTENERVIGIVKKKTVGMQKLGIIDI